MQLWEERGFNISILGLDCTEYFFFGGAGMGAGWRETRRLHFPKSINKSENVQFQQNTIVEKTKCCLILINHHTDTV